MYIQHSVVAGAGAGAKKLPDFSRTEAGANFYTLAELE